MNYQTVDPADTQLDAPYQRQFDEAVNGLDFDSRADDPGLAEEWEDDK